MTHGEYIRLGAAIGEMLALKDALVDQVGNLQAYCLGPQEPTRLNTRNRAAAVRTCAEELQRAAEAIIAIVAEPDRSAG